MLVSCAKIVAHIRAGPIPCGTSSILLNIKEAAEIDINSLVGLFKQSPELCVRVYTSPTAAKPLSTRFIIFGCVSKYFAR